MAERAGAYRNRARDTPSGEPVAHCNARGVQDSAGYQRIIVAGTVIAVLYNALLAIFAAQGGPASYAGAVACEVIIIAGALGVATLAGLTRTDALPLGYLAVTVGITLVISLVAERPFIDSLRNVLIIVAFTLLGGRATLATIRATFLIVISVTLAVLVLEVVSLPTYAALFRPGDYLAKTRGYVQPEFYSDVGLSLGTIAYSNRFSFGLFDGPRTSSVFLEQVGINCFAIIIMIYMMTMYPLLSKWEKIIAAGTLIFILVTNNARMASLLVPIFVVAYFVASRLPRWPALVIPFALLATTWLLFQFTPVNYGDDLVGRLAITYLALSKMTAGELLFGNIDLLKRRFDTGYGYILISATIFGALAYWAYLSLVLPYKQAIQRRATWALATYIYLWLLVGGTGSFSMKTAALLWLLVGHIRMRDLPENDAEPASAGSASPRPPSARARVRACGPPRLRVG